MFQYLEFDRLSAKYRVAGSYATKGAIRKANGVILLGTYRLAEAASVDKDGFWRTHRSLDRDVPALLREP